jgi:hypothetical protein
MSLPSYAREEALRKAADLLRDSSREDAVFFVELLGFQDRENIYQALAELHLGEDAKP